MADLEADAAAEQRAMDALLSRGQLASTMRGQSDAYEAENTGALSGLLGNMRGAADAYRAENTAAASGLLGDMRNSADAYQQNNARMIADIARTNTDYLREAQDRMLDRRQQWDMNTFNQQVGVAEGARTFDQNENQAGWGFGYGVAGDDANRFNAGQASANDSAFNAFTGMTPGVQGATNTRINATGGTQAAAGQSVSGGANFAGNLISGLFGGGGGGTSENKDEQRPTTGGR